MCEDNRGEYNLITYRGGMYLVVMYMVVLDS